MNAATGIDKKIAGYLELLNTKQKKAVLGIVKAFADEEQGTNLWQNEAFVAEMDKRTHDLETGKVKGYSWDEVKKMGRKAITEMKGK